MNEIEKAWVETTIESAINEVKTLYNTNERRKLFSRSGHMPTSNIKTLKFIGAINNLHDKGVEKMASPIMKYFEFGHLPEKLQDVSEPLAKIANWVEDQLPDGPEKSAGLRKLLEAKDCFVRAAL